MDRYWILFSNPLTMSDGDDSSKSWDLLIFLRCVNLRAQRRRQEVYAVSPWEVTLAIFGQAA